jgi:hypothetical protein
MGRLRLHGQYLGFDGSVRGARQYAQPGLDPGGQDFVGEAVAIARLWSRHMPIAN